MSRARTALLLILPLIPLAFLPACQGPGLSAGGRYWIASRPRRPIRFPTGQPFPKVPAAQPRTPVTSRPARTIPGTTPGAQVALSGRDLAAVRNYFGRGADDLSTRWVIGDRVDVIASKEFFEQLITVSRGPLVSRTDRKLGRGDLLVTLTYLGHEGIIGADNTPRLLIGTGWSILARKKLVLRFVETRNAKQPVRIQIRARGSAKQGHKEQIIKEANNLITGGDLVRRGRGWSWQPYER